MRDLFFQKSHRNKEHQKSKYRRCNEWNHWSSMIESSDDKRSDNSSYTRNRSIITHHLSYLLSRLTRDKWVNPWLESTHRKRKKTNDNIDKYWRSIDGKKTKTNHHNKKRSSDHFYFRKIGSNILHKGSLIYDRNETHDNHRIPYLISRKSKYIVSYLSHTWLNRRERKWCSERKTKESNREWCKTKRSIFLHHLFLMLFWFRKKKNNQKKIQGNSKNTSKEYALSSTISSKKASDSWPNQKSESKHRTDHSHIFSTILGCWDICYICLYNSISRPTQSSNHTSSKKYKKHQRKWKRKKARRKGKPDNNVSNKIKGRGNYEKIFSSKSIWKTSKKKSTNKHTDGINSLRIWIPRFIHTKVNDYIWQYRYKNPHPKNIKKCCYKNEWKTGLENIHEDRKIKKFLFWRTFFR